MLEVRLRVWLYMVGLGDNCVSGERDGLRR